VLTSKIEEEEEEKLYTNIEYDVEVQKVAASHTCRVAMRLWLVLYALIICL
jgi:hypothetical protein